MRRIDMDIPQSARDQIRKYLGGETGAFLSKIGGRIGKYSNEWRLSGLSFMPTNTINLLYACESEIYGPCVLKLCIPGPEVETEAMCLRFYDGRGYCKLWAFDLTDDALLLERIAPGDQMWAVADYYERARLFGEMLKCLPLPYDGPVKFPTYLSWMDGIRGKLIEMGGLGDVLFFLDEAIGVYSGLKQRHKKECLLHGDLHQENMLLDSNGRYAVIDPKGVVDAPVMECARFLMNEVPCDEGRIREMAAIIGSIAGFSAEDIISAMFVDAALGQSWCMEEHYETEDAFEAARRTALETCGYVWELLKNDPFAAARINGRDR
ncbi:MAG: aminoglycoside phosphotransferase family protein [Defluviitaleaceae bacterium]|nr:aminoglycoside phosphotransferase family protein [Defluviitaleaceae bacterium]